MEAVAVIAVVLAMVCVICSAPVAEKEAKNSSCFGKNNGYHGVEGNCSRFVLCIDGSTHVFPCPVGLVWSLSSGYCDIPVRAACPCDFITDNMMTSTEDAVVSSGEEIEYVIHVPGRRIQVQKKMNNMVEEKTVRGMKMEKGNKEEGDEKVMYDDDDDDDDDIDDSSSQEDENSSEEDGNTSEEHEEEDAADSNQSAEKLTDAKELSEEESEVAEDGSGYTDDEQKSINEILLEDLLSVF